MKIVRAIKKRDAKLCLDCDHIYSGRTCPVCASESAMNVSRMISGPSAHQFPFHGMTEIHDPAKLRPACPDVRFTA